VVALIAACIVGPLTYLGVYLLIRANGTRVLISDDRQKSLQDCISLEAQLAANLQALPRHTPAHDQIVGISSVVQGIIDAMRKDPDKLADVVNFDLNYVQPVAKAVETYAQLNKETLPGNASDALKTKLEGLFPQALARLKEYQETLFTGDVQQIEGLVDMLEDSFGSTPAPTGAAPK
jgi:hypothetical protein